MSWYPEGVNAELGKNFMFGMQVFTQDDETTKRQKIKLSSGICTPEFEKEMNSWLAERFGFEYQAYNVGGRLIVHSDVLRDLDQLKVAAVEKRVQNRMT